MATARSVEILDAMMSAVVRDVAVRLRAWGDAGEILNREQFIDEISAVLGPSWVKGRDRFAAQARQAELLSVEAFSGRRLVLYEDLRPDHSAAVPRALVEAAWAVGRSNSAHPLCDALGIVSAYGQSGFVAGYLIAAATNTRWKDPDLCKDWFAADPGTVNRVAPIEYAIGRGPCFPESREEVNRHVPELPPAIDFTTIAVAPFRMRERMGGLKRCSIRCARVDPVFDFD